LAKYVPVLTYVGKRGFERDDGERKRLSKKKEVMSRSRACPHACTVNGGEDSNSAEGDNMTSQGDLRKSFFGWTTAKQFASPVVTMFVLLLAIPAFAQSDSSDTLSDHQSSGGAVVDQNPHPQTANSAQEPSLPNAPSAAATYRPTSELTFGDRFAIYRKSILRPYSLVGPAFGAGIGQWEDEPPEWGQGAKGYGRRVASGMGRQLISETIRFGFAAVDGEDPRYHRSQDTGVWKRTQHAIVETFTSETPGGRMPAYSRFAGTYGAAFISNAWYPDSRATPGWALRRGSTALASSVGFHIFEEFLPRKYFKAIGVSNDQ
jgi:hypothetical protein